MASEPSYWNRRGPPVSVAQKQYSQVNQSANKKETRTAAIERAALDPGERKRVIEVAASNLRQYYA